MRRDPCGSVVGRETMEEVVAIKDLALRALDTASAAGATYADARAVQTGRQEISVKHGRLDGLEEDESQGLGVRVLVSGAWGFACTSDPSPAAAERTPQAEGR